MKLALKLRWLAQRGRDSWISRSKGRTYNEVDDLHLGVAVRTFQRINFPYFLNAVRQVLDGIRRGLYVETSITSRSSGVVVEIEFVVWSAALLEYQPLSHHLKRFFGDMLGDSGYELFGGYDRKVPLALAILVIHRLDPSFSFWSSNDPELIFRVFGK